MANEKSSDTLSLLTTLQRWKRFQFFICLGSIRCTFVTADISVYIAVHGSLDDSARDDSSTLSRFCDDLKNEAGIVSCPSERFSAPVIPVLAEFLL